MVLVAVLPHRRLAALEEQYPGALLEPELHLLDGVGVAQPLDVREVGRFPWMLQCLHLRLHSKLIIIVLTSGLFFPKMLAMNHLA